MSFGDLGLFVPRVASRTIDASPLDGLGQRLMSGDPTQTADALRLLVALEVAVLRAWIAQQDPRVVALLRALLGLGDGAGGGGGSAPSGGGGYAPSGPSGGGYAPSGPSGGGSSAPSGPSGTPAPVGGATPSAPTAGGPLFGPGKRVLQLGDSHTVGNYGQELERLIEGTGSTVDRQAKVGVNPSYFRSQVADLIRRDNPDTIVVSLGANMRGASQAQIDREVKGLEQAIRDAGSSARIVWVGPPRTREDMQNGGSALAAFDAKLRAAIGPNSSYQSSADLTSYRGSDGIHYETAAAREWARRVFAALGG